MGTLKIKNENVVVSLVENKGRFFKTIFIKSGERFANCIVFDFDKVDLNDDLSCVKFVKQSIIRELSNIKYKFDCEPIVSREIKATLESQLSFIGDIYNANKELNNDRV